MTDEPRPDQPDAATGPVPPASVPEGASSTPGVPPLPPTAFPRAASQQPGGPHPWQGAASQPAAAYGAEPPAPSGVQPPAPYGTRPVAPYGVQPPAPAAGAAPGGPRPPWGAPVASPPRTLSVLSLVAGAVGLSTTLVTLGLTVVVAVAGIVLGHLASRREPASRGLWLAGLITGYVGVLATICLWVGLLAFWLALVASTAGASVR
ncbi:DUF4190 domain-containing protein [Frigoribacterium salinisoli]